MTDELYSVREAARRADVPYRTIYRWIDNGILPTSTTPLRVSVQQVKLAKIIARQHRSDVQQEAQKRGKR